MKVLVFDTETTGLPKERFASFKDTHLWPHIMQLSFMMYDTDTWENVYAYGWWGPRPNESLKEDVVLWEDGVTTRWRVSF